MRVLIAEDDEFSRLLLQRAVGLLGHDCLTASDGPEALALFQTEKVDVIISDWMMPGLNGPELCRRIRAEGGLGRPYFILLTGMSEKKDVMDGMQAGADDYLKKPLDREELQVRLLAAARVADLHRELADKDAQIERLKRALGRTASA